jgi:phosphate starvation-inducible PhoH-like protein
MHETLISIEGLDPVVILGNENTNLHALQRLSPKLRIVSRGHDILVKGSRDDVGRFEEIMRMVVWHVDRYSTLTIDDLDRLAKSDEKTVLKDAGTDNVIVHGPSGNKVYARTPNQYKLVDAVAENDMVFAVGPAGTGKTYTAVALAVKALKEKRVKKIILTRPAVEAGENLGFLPGDMKEKLDPYLQPLYDALTDMIPPEKVAAFIDKGVIEVAPLAFMRGRTLDKAFVILDEAQNTTIPQIKMFLTRMGRDAKYIITGDETQVDLPFRQKSGLVHVLKILKEVEGISTIRLTGVDVMRHRLVRAVITAFEKDEK